ncbi:hypothetical protein B0H17DRAFT_1148059, partial [Mycena rosella]
MSTAILLPMLLLACGLPAIAQSSIRSRAYTGQETFGATWDVVAPTMDGFVQYEKFDVNTDSKFAASQGQQGWVPMNTTGSLASGNLYTPFYEFDGDATKAGWRLSGDESSEVVFVLKDNYSAPTPSFVAGNNDGFSSLITMTQLTYLDAPTVAARDIYSNSTFIDLPFTSHTVLIGKESIDNGSKK